MLKTKQIQQTLCNFVEKYMTIRVPHAVYSMWSAESMSIQDKVLTTYKWQSSGHLKLQMVK